MVHRRCLFWRSLRLCAPWAPSRAAVWPGRGAPGRACHCGQHENSSQCPREPWPTHLGPGGLQTVEKAWEGTEHGACTRGAGHRGGPSQGRCPAVPLRRARGIPPGVRRLHGWEGLPHWISRGAPQGKAAAAGSERCVPVWLPRGEPGAAVAWGPSAAGPSPCAWERQRGAVSSLGAPFPGPWCATGVPWGWVARGREHGCDGGRGRGLRGRGGGRRAQTHGTAWLLRALCTLQGARAVS